MIGSITRITARRRIALATTALTALAFAGAGAEDRAGDSPGVTTAADLDGQTATTRDPDELEAGTRDPDDLAAESGSPDDATADAEDPDAVTVGAESLADHEGHTYDLTDLPKVDPDDGLAPILMPGQEDWKPSSDPQVTEARSRLVRAQNRAQAARTRYGTMMANDYPRGTAREEIVRERDESMAELEKAKSALRAVHGDVPASRW